MSTLTGEKAARIEKIYKDPSGFQSSKNTVKGCKEGQPRHHTRGGKRMDREQHREKEESKRLQQLYCQ